MTADHSDSSARESAPPASPSDSAAGSKSSGGGLGAKTVGLTDLQTMVSLCKRRGFVFQSSEIYGGLNSCWDYGPLGVALKLNVKKAWWNAMTRRDDIVGIDASILMAPMVWKASGHVDGFSDPMVDCKKC